jgi:hypothetical protein
MARVVVTDLANLTEFGQSVVLSETHLVVGAPKAKGARTDTGVVYVFELP